IVVRIGPVHAVELIGGRVRRSSGHRLEAEHAQQQGDGKPDRGQAREATWFRFHLPFSFSAEGPLLVAADVGRSVAIGEKKISPARNGCQVSTCFAQKRLAGEPSALYRPAA